MTQDEDGLAGKKVIGWDRHSSWWRERKFIVGPINIWIGFKVGWSWTERREY